MNLYNIKKKVLKPYIWYMRHKEREKTGFIKSALELHYYRPSFYGFIRANIEKPDILYDAPIKQGAVVMDVGGYIGEWAEKIQTRYNARIFSFELDPSTLPRLQKRFASNPNVQCLDYGLGGQDCTLSLKQKDMGSTLYDKAGDDHAASVTVQVRDIVKVMDELQLSNVDLLKLNIEGGEYDVLERLLESGKIRDVDCLMVQFHEWLDNANWRRFKIRRQLRKTHRQIWNHTFIWEQWVRL